MILSVTVMAQTPGTPLTESYSSTTFTYDVNSSSGIQTETHPNNADVHSTSGSVFIPLGCASLFIVIFFCVTGFSKERVPRKNEDLFSFGSSKSDVEYQVYDVLQRLEYQDSFRHDFDDISPVKTKEDGKKRKDQDKHSSNETINKLWQSAVSLSQAVSGSSMHFKESSTDLERANSLTDTESRHSECDKVSQTHTCTVELALNVKDLFKSSPAPIRNSC